MSENAKEVPLHVKAASFMRDKIYAHEWAPEHQIPTEHELCEMLGMSRGTVRRAIKTLVDENLLVQMHGRGTFVTSAVLTHPTGSMLMSFAESLASQSGVALGAFSVRLTTGSPASDSLASTFPRAW